MKQAKQRRKSPESSLIDIAIVQGLANDMSIIDIAQGVGLKTISVQTRIFRLKNRYGLKHTHSLVAYFYKLNYIK